MYKNYKTKLTELELLRLNCIENQTIKNSCMSILGYLIKKNNEENKKYEDAGLSDLKNPLTFKITFRKFLKLYNRSHTKLSIGTLKNRIDILIELKLIERVDKSTYSFFRDELNNNLNKKINNLNDDQTVDTTSVEVVNDEHKYINNKIIKDNKDIDIYNSCSVQTTEMSPEVYQNYLNSQEKLSSIEEMLSITEKMFKIMKVRSPKIKGYALNVLNYWETVTKTNVYNYVAKAIENARERYYRERQQRFNNNNSEDSFNNYPQRDYDFDKLEKGLLGWA